MGLQLAHEFYRDRLLTKLYVALHWDNPADFGKSWLRSVEPTYRTGLSQLVVGIATIIRNTKGFR